MPEIEIIAPELQLTLETQAQLEHYELQIRTEFHALNGEILKRNYIMGKHLLEVQNLLPRGAFEAWCEKNVPFHVQHARKMMAMAIGFTPEQIAAIPNMSPSTAYVLAQADMPELIEIAVSRVASGDEIKAGEAREMVRYHRTRDDMPLALETPSHSSTPSRIEAQAPKERTQSPDSLEELRTTHPELHATLTASTPSTELSLETVFKALELPQHFGTLIMLGATFEKREFQTYQAPNPAWQKMGLFDENNKPTKKALSLSVHIRELARILDVMV